MSSEKVCSWAAWLSFLWPHWARAIKNMESHTWEFPRRGNAYLKMPAFTYWSQGEGHFNETCFTKQCWDLVSCWSCPSWCRINGTSMLLGIIWAKYCCPLPIWSTSSSEPNQGNILCWLFSGNVVEGQIKRDAGSIRKHTVRQPEGDTCCICAFQICNLKCSLERYFRTINKVSINTVIILWTHSAEYRRKRSNWTPGIGNPCIAWYLCDDVLSCPKLNADGFRCHSAHRSHPELLDIWGSASWFSFVWPPKLIHVLRFHASKEQECFHQIRTTGCYLFSLID